MSAIARLGDSIVTGTAPSRFGRDSKRRAARIATRALLILLLFVAAGAIGLFMYAQAYSGRVYQGVRMGGVDIGGMDREAAASTLEEAFRAYASKPVTLATGGKQFAISPDEAGLALDLPATLDRAYGWGRDGSAWSQTQTMAYGLVRGVNFPLVIDVDPAKAEAALQSVAPEIISAPIDAGIQIEPGDAPALVVDQPGVMLDAAPTLQEFSATASRLGQETVPLRTRLEPARIASSSLATVLPAAKAALDHPLVLTDGDQTWHLPVSDLSRVIAVDPATATVQIDRRPLITMVESLAADLNRDVVDAGVVVDDDGKLAVTPSTTGVLVDPDASVAAIVHALQRGEDSARLAVTRTPPAIDDLTAERAVTRGEALLNAGMAIVWDGGRSTLDRGDLLQALTIKVDSGRNDPFSFGLDRAVVGSMLGDLAAGFDQPVSDAEFRLVNGKITAVSESRAGRSLDVESGVNTVLAAWGKPAPVANLKVDTIAPKWSASDASRIVLGDEILGEGSTYYGDSSGPRRQNVELAASLESGWLVPPGGVFSYAEYIGPISLGQGFVTGYGITEQEGQFATAPVVGGGICQVSTTLFQSVFWAGLPIVERYQHPYYYRIYGESPTGMPGLDAMVNIEPDWALDFKFKNTTGNWLAVVVNADGDNVSSRIVGTNPGWEVAVSDPEITNRITAEPRMQYTDSPELPTGQELVVERASDGFDVAIERVVKKDGETIDVYNINASFTPSRNLTLRGTGTGANPASTPPPS